MNGTKGPRPLHVPGRKVCLTCRHALSYDEETREYLHSPDHLAWDHDPIPVTDMEFEFIHEKCDFCFADGTEWILPVQPFEAAPGHMSGGDWGACSPCAELIRARKWGSLARRQRLAYPAIHGGQPMPEEIGLAVRLMWAQLRKNITGPLRMIER